MSRTIFYSIFQVMEKSSTKCSWGEAFYANHSTSTNYIQIANPACISLDAYIDHVLGHGIPITFAHYSISGPNLAGLHGLEQCWQVVNSILANAPDLANISVMMDYLWSNGFLGSNIKQNNNSVWSTSVTISMLSEHAVSKTILVCWHLDVANMITNQYFSMSLMKYCNCACPSSIIANWQIHSGGWHLDYVSI